VSIVSVHGPQTFGSKAVVGAGPVQASVNPSNGLIWNFQLAKPSNRPAADFDWAFPGGTPAAQADSKGPVAVTYAAAGSKTATLTVSGASTEEPVNGSYPVTVTAVSGVAPLMAQQQGVGEMSSYRGEIPGPEDSTEAPEAPPEAEPQEAPAPEPEPAPEEPPEGAYDPADHTVEEVKTHAEGLSDDEIRAILDAEVAGKNRSTLVSALEDMLPYDPGAHTVQEVVDHATANPDEVQAILDAENAGKQRSTLVSQLEAMLA
jgi:PKD repeat protein